MEKSVVLKVVFFESNKDLSCLLKNDPSSVIVCPNPKTADNLRDFLEEREIVTISKWVADHLRTQKKTRIKKSDLMIKLSAIWRHYYPKEKTSTFMEAFELFTEIRSYTLNVELLADLFLDLDKNILRSFLLFWTYVEEEKIIDEHLAYKKIASAIDSGTISFVGFKHMSGVQIDMLKEIGEKHEVSLFFPRAVYEETHPSDWIRWLGGEFGESQKEKKNKRKVKYILLPKGKANVVVREFLNKNQKHNLLFVNTETSLSFLQEVQIEKISFKTQEDIFSAEVESFFINLHEWKKLKSDDEGSRENLLEYMEASQHKMERCGNYRQVKVIQLVREALEEYSNFSIDLDDFLLEMLKIITTLNLPRISFLNLTEESKRSFFDLGSIDFNANEKSMALLVTNGMGGLSFAQKNENKFDFASLAAIGPIKRPGLDFLFYKYELRKILEKKETVLLIEENVLEMDFSWREILKVFFLEEEFLDIKYPKKKIQDYVFFSMKKGPFAQSFFSASKIQTFLDCPRKFYFNYIEKIENKPELSLKISPNELGILEHKAIEQYFSLSQTPLDKNNLKIDVALHGKICRELFSQHMETKKNFLNEAEKSRGLSEMMHYSLNGILFLFEMIYNKNGREIYFEVPLGENPWRIKGAIDCIIECENKKVVVLDFKRTSASIGNKKEIVEFKKIQLWVYLLILKVSGREIDSFGYVDLSEPKANDVIKNSDDEINKAQMEIEKIIKEMTTSTSFLPLPREKKVCTFCPITLFCAKEDVFEK